MSPQLRAPVDRVGRRLRSLRDSEAIGAILVPAVLVWYWVDRGGAISWGMRLPPLALVVLLLVQGTLYWHLKVQSLRSARDGAALPDWFCGAYRRLRAASAISLVGVALALAVGAGIRGRAAWSVNAADLAWGAGLLAFAALEYVNYYHWQLMHDSVADWRYLGRYRRLRRAPLSTDLSRCRAAPPSPRRGGDPPTTRSS